MDLRCPTLGHSRQIKHRNNPKISKQIPESLLTNIYRRNRQPGNKQKNNKSKKDSNICEWDHLESKGIRKNGKSNICETV